MNLRARTLAYELSVRRNMAAASSTTPVSLTTPNSPPDISQPSTPSSTTSNLDDIEKHILTLLHSASQLLTALSTIAAPQADQAKQHAHTFLTTLQQLRLSLAAATSASLVNGAVLGERQLRRSAYLDQLMFQLECEMTAHVSEQLDDIEQLAHRSSDRARQRLAEAGLG